MKKALIIGVDHYAGIKRLYGCVNDAFSVKNVLERNYDGSVNFDCQIHTATSQDKTLVRSFLSDKISELFTSRAEIVLFYFSGHGYTGDNGGYILGSDARRGDDGVSLDYILNLANNSPATNKVIFLDSCHSGEMGNPSVMQNTALISEGITILTASTKEQYATEVNGSGIFTSLLVDALAGSASNILGDITPGSVYAHIDQSLGAWEQRPIFKTNIRKFISLRKVAPSIELNDLRKIEDLFPNRGFEFKLDPTYEPQMKGRDEGMPDPIEDNTRIFAILQKYNRLNLLKPIGVEHMWYAAMESKSCRLTELGEHYRNLVVNGRI